MTRALVTGGAGFVGRHLCRKLLSEGISVDCVDNLSPIGSGLPPERWPLFDPRTSPDFRFIEGDCRTLFERQSERYDFVFHLAALIGGRKLIEGAPLVIADNLSVDAAMWKWAAQTAPRIVVYASSSAAYPIGLQTKDHHVPLREDMCDPRNVRGTPDATYGWSKLTGEYLMHHYRELTGATAFAIRPFSGYGEDQSTDYPFPSICRRAILQAGADMMTVWGSGRQMRDFVHIDDCVDIIWRCCQTPPKDGAINISSGKATDFLTLATMACEAVGYSPRVVGSSGTPEGVFARVGDRTLQDALGLIPKIDLRDGVQRCVEFQRRDLAGDSRLVPDAAG